VPKEDPFPKVKTEAPKEGWFPRVQTGEIQLFTRLFGLLDEILLVLIALYLLWALNNWLRLV
jgi:hypothetical protein